MRIFRFLLFLVCATAFAQSMTSVVVTVTDPDGGAALPGATVTLIDDADVRFHATTDSDGVARFQVPPGKYQVIAELQGCEAERKILTVGANETRFAVTLGKRPGASWGVTARPWPASETTPAPPPPMSILPSVTPTPVASMPEPVPEMAMAPMESMSAVTRATRSAKRAVDVEPGKNYAVVKVYYATDRAYTGEPVPAKLYGPQRGKLRLGIARISMPREHKLGELEAPSILSFQFRRDPAKHVVLISVSPQRPADFYAKLSNSIRDSDNREAFVFIHGYNVTFEDAARRTAQIKYDLGFDGPAILYSWPSWGKTSEYPADGKNASWAAADLSTFLSDLAMRSGASAIHLVAHSMGNLVLAEALKTLATGSAPPHFDQIVLAAPDLDADRFKRELAPAFMKLARHVTLYASSRDEALAAGKTFDRSPRLGDTGSGIVIMPPMDTIDVSDIDTSFIGHSYVAENRTVLSDVFCLIHGATEAATRCRLARVGRHWRFAAAMEQLTTLANYRCSAASCLIR